MARHSTSLGPLASLARSSVPGATGSPHDGQTIAGLAPQPRGRPHHAIAAARANEFDLGGIFQRMVGQSSPSANGELGLAIPQTLLVAADEVIECISRVHRVSRLSGIGLARQAWIGARSPVTR